MPASTIISKAVAAALLASGAVNGLPTAEPQTQAPNGQDCVMAPWGTPSTELWQQNNTTDWLNTWWDQNAPYWGSQGFARSFGNMWLGDYNHVCNIDDSATCDFQECDNQKLFSSGQPQTLYVLQAMKNLRDWQNLVVDANQWNAATSALRQLQWAQDFYREPPDHTLALNELIGFLQMLGGLLAAPMGLKGGISSTLFNGVAGGFNMAIKPPEDQTLVKAAELGNVLADWFEKGTMSVADMNRDLFMGRDFQGAGDIRKYFEDGQMVGNVLTTEDWQHLVSYVGTMSKALAIQTLWQQQGTFIMSYRPTGSSCEDDRLGPQEAKYCDPQGLVHYLYSYDGSNVVAPPGLDKLGKDNFWDITIQDVIQSSVGAYNVAQYNYTSDLARQRALDAVVNGDVNEGKTPQEWGPKWEGTFRIPVCDVTDTRAAQGFPVDMVGGYGRRPQLCGPICSNNADTTTKFFQAAGIAGTLDSDSNCAAAKQVPNDPVPPATVLDCNRDCFAGFVVDPGLCQQQCGGFGIGK